MPKAMAPSRAAFESYACVMRIVVTPFVSSNSCVSSSEPIGSPTDSYHRGRLDVDLLRRWAYLLDSAFEIPGLHIRFGLDAILGLVPGIGDLASPSSLARSC
jgi:hypothetical protein